MKSINEQFTVFTPLMEEENSIINGGGFAFDAGRALRWFIIYSGYGSSGAGGGMATADFITNMYLHTK